MGGGQLLRALGRWCMGRRCRPLAVVLLRPTWCEVRCDICSRCRETRKVPTDVHCTLVLQMYLCLTDPFGLSNCRCAVLLTLRWKRKGVLIVEGVGWISWTCGCCPRQASREGDRWVAGRRGRGGWVRRMSEFCVCAFTCWGGWVYSVGRERCRKWFEIADALRGLQKINSSQEGQPQPPTYSPSLCLLMIPLVSSSISPRPLLLPSYSLLSSRISDFFPSTVTFCALPIPSSSGVFVFASLWGRSRNFQSITDVSKMTQPVHSWRHTHGFGSLLNVWPVQR